MSLSNEFIFLNVDLPFLVVEAWVKYLEGLFELLLDLKESFSEMSDHCIFLLFLLLLTHALVHKENFLLQSFLNAFISGFRYIADFITREGDIESPLLWGHIKVCLEECSIVEGVGDESWDLFLFKNGNLRRILGLLDSLPHHLSLIVDMQQHSGNVSGGNTV